MIPTSQTTEGVMTFGATSDETDDAIQADIAAAHYRRSDYDVK